MDGTAADEIPAVGLGTYGLRGREGADVVRRALELGYRHVDTADLYDNHAAVGEGIAAAPVDREAVFLATKVWKTDLAYDDVLRSARRSLDELGVEYVDLLLVHAPNSSVPVAETMAAMDQLRAAGLARHVGVSNFSVDQLREAMDAADAPILTDQVEYHPYEDRADLLSFCRENDVVLTAYSPLAKGRVATDDTLAAIGRRYGKSAAQVAIRWLIQQDGVVAIPKAAGEAHLRENLAVFDFELTPEETARIADLGGGPVERVRSLLGL